MATQISRGDAQAVKVFGAALFAATNRKAELVNDLTGPSPEQADAESKLKLQSSPDMPIVQVRDLQQSAGDTVSVDLINVSGGKPIMGDRQREGKGVSMTMASRDVVIDKHSWVVSAGGSMTQQRTKHNLRKLALAQQGGYWPRYRSQQALVQLAGDRGDQVDTDWIIPQRFITGSSTAADVDFDEIMVNTVQAPTYNRHYVVNGTSFTQGGLQLGSIASTDVWKLAHLDVLRAMIDNAVVKLPRVRIPGDPAADYEPMWLLMLPPLAYNQLLTDTTATGNIRAFQQYAIERASYMGINKHPLFIGKVGMWNGIFVKKLERSVRFLPGSNTKVVLVANRYTATESNQTVNAGLGANKAVERALLLGGQALCDAFGGAGGRSTGPSTWKERWFNFEEDLEVMGSMMFGMAKSRFSLPDGAGNLEPTDLGVYAIDSAVTLL